MKVSGKDNVLLDISHKPSNEIKKSFPSIYKRCLEFGFDITKTSIPVVPAAHYTCGGIVTDLEGRTDITNLYAIGETSCTGLHGANRMASNSLLECVVFAKAASKNIKINFTHNRDSIPEWDNSKVIKAGENILINHNWDASRRLMWNYVGIVRSNDRLKKAKDKMRLITNEVKEFYKNYEVTSDFLELRNLVQISELIIESAIKRKESRGLHYNLDYPKKFKKAKSTILSPR